MVSGPVARESGDRQGRVATSVETSGSAQAVKEGTYATVRIVTSLKTGNFHSRGEIRLCARVD